MEGGNFYSTPPTPISSGHQRSHPWWQLRAEANSDGQTIQVPEKFVTQTSHSIMLENKITNNGKLFSWQYLKASVL